MLALKYAVFLPKWLLNPLAETCLETWVSLLYMELIISFCPLLMAIKTLEYWGIMTSILNAKAGNVIWNSTVASYSALQATANSQQQPYTMEEVLHYLPSGFDFVTHFFLYIFGHTDLEP